MFDEQHGDVDLKQNHINEKGLPVITSGVNNNGVLGKTDIEAKVFPANTITVDMFGYSFFRDYEYKMVTHARVFALIPKFEMNRLIGNYIVSNLKYLLFVYSYSNMCSFYKIKDNVISLPITPTGTLDFDYMERYIKAMEKVVIADVVKYKNKVIEETKKVVGD